VYHAERRLLTCNEPHAKFVLIEAKDLETKRAATKAFDAKWPSAIQTEILSVHLVSKLPAMHKSKTKSNELRARRKEGSGPDVERPEAEKEPSSSAIEQPRLFSRLGPADCSVLAGSEQAHPGL
jgi:hypothetical protein